MTAASVLRKRISHSEIITKKSQVYPSGGVWVNLFQDGILVIGTRAMLTTWDLSSRVTYYHHVYRNDEIEIM